MGTTDIPAAQEALNEARDCLKSAQDYIDPEDEFGPASEAVLAAIAHVEEAIKELKAA